MWKLRELVRIIFLNIVDCRLDMSTFSKVLVLIPARMGSSRFPGKPMALIHGKPMISWVYDSVVKNTLNAEVVVATCDEIIFDHIISNGGKAVMTSASHERASDRCAEALIYLENKFNLRYEIVVMVQGDEPMISPVMISEAVNPMFIDKEIKVVNLMGKITSNEEFEDRNCIKVVCDVFGNAIYFSREPIPTRVKSKNIAMQKQVCVIPFRRDYLIEYTNLKPTPLEIAESVDMMRVLEHGGKVRMIPTDCVSYSVDTPEDLMRVSSMINLD